MANVLKVAVVHAIIGLLDQGWSYRRIARELGVHRETVARYDRLIPFRCHTLKYSPVKPYQILNRILLPGNLTECLCQCTF